MKTGKFECPIPKPVVIEPETVYRWIEFAPGDLVYVNADGCVQTGGHWWSGDTWKRYVNPSGKDSDHLYHGLVRIPTAKLAGTDVGNSLTRIKNVIGRLITVTGEGSPVSDLVLHLGYEDDDYSDNGYYGHDDGTEDQCRPDPDKGHDGGPAHVMITIYRGVNPDPPTSRYDFDVLSSQTDPNGFLLNPHWSWQDKPGNHGKIPTSDLCHHFSKRDIGRRPAPNFPDCTDQAGLDTIDAPFPESVNWHICVTLGKLPGLFVDSPFAGHVNWFPVTITGTSNWGGHSIDDDYEFKLYSDNADDFSLYLNDKPPNDSRRYLHVEFDSDETIDHFHTEEWQKLPRPVDDAEDAKGQLAECDEKPCSDALRAHLQTIIDLPHKLFDGQTIMTGMFGYDGEHGDGKSELHPLYAMATRRACTHPPEDCGSNGFDPSDDIWLIFVRNRGDEGYCSSQIWYGGFESYTFRLPWQDKMTSVEVDWEKTKFEGIERPTVRTVPPLPSVEVSPMARRREMAAIPSPGVYVTFDLSLAPMVNGALHLKWTSPSGPRRPPRELEPAIPVVARREVAPSGERDEPEDKLKLAIDSLSTQQRTSVQKARATARPSATGVHAPAPGGRVVARTGSTGRAPIAGSAGAATRKLARDTAQMHALCAATHNAPPGLPPKVCKR